MNFCQQNYGSSVILLHWAIVLPAFWRVFSVRVVKTAFYVFKWPFEEKLFFPKRVRFLISFRISSDKMFNLMAKFFRRVFRNCFLSVSRYISNVSQTWKKFVVHFFAFFGHLGGKFQPSSKVFLITFSKLSSN